MTATARASNFYGVRIQPSFYDQGTWLEAEELAYNTYSGTHWGSGRRCKALFPDGKARIVRIGIPDTYFSIPGHDSRGNKGCVTFDELDNGSRVIRWIPYPRDSELGRKRGDV